MSTRFKAWSTRATLATLAILGLVLQGCSTTVFKTTAGSYVEASNGVVQALQQAESSAGAIILDKKAIVASHDAACPMNRARVYLRMTTTGHLALPGYFTPLMEGTSPPQACEALRRCESDPARCTSACYEDDESGCINYLAQFYSAQAGRENPPGSMNAKWKEMGGKLQDIALDGNSANRFLAASSLQLYTHYLDVLQEAANDQPGDLATRVTNFSNRLTAVNGDFQTLTGAGLVDATTATNLTAQLGALGTVLQDFKNNRQNNRDTAAIKKAVRDMDAVAQFAFDEIGNRLKGDLALLASRDQRAALQEQLAISEEYKAPGTTPDRRAELAREHQALVPLPEASFDSAANQLLTAAKVAHDTLVQLVLDPSSAQLRQIAEQEFASFRTSAVDLASLINLLK